MCCVLRCVNILRQPVQTHPECDWAGPNSACQEKWACWTASQPGCSPLTRCRWTWSNPETTTSIQYVQFSKPKKKSYPVQYRIHVNIPLSWALFPEPCTNVWPRTQSRNLCGRARGRLSVPGQSHRSEDDTKGHEAETSVCQLIVPHQAPRSDFSTPAAANQILRMAMALNVFPGITSDRFSREVQLHIIYVNRKCGTQGFGLYYNIFHKVLKCIS